MKVIRASVLMALLTLLLAGEAAAQTTIRMNANQRLDKGQKIEVAGKGYLFMQPDGDLVLYDAANKPRWATGTNGRAVSHVIMQPDGNLVVYRNKTPLWASDTWNANARGGYFEIDLNTWSGGIYRADGSVAKVLFGSPAPPVQPNTATAPVAQPTPTPQTVQIVQGPTTVIAGTPAPATNPLAPTAAAIPPSVLLNMAQPTPSQPVQLNIGTAPLAQPTPTPQTVQIVQGPTTVISGTLAPATSYSNLGTTAAV
jgi:hypothetical protein